MSDYGKTFSKLAQHFALKSTNRSTFFRGNSASWLNKCMHGQPRSWVQYSTSHAYCHYVVLLSQNGLRSNLREYIFLKISWRIMLPDPPSLAFISMHT